MSAAVANNCLRMTPRRPSLILLNSRTKTQSQAWLNQALKALPKDILSRVQSTNLERQFTVLGKLPNSRSYFFVSDSYNTARSVSSGSSFP